MARAPRGGAQSAQGYPCLILSWALRAAHTTRYFQDPVPKYLDPELVQVVQGAIPETTKVLELRWNHSEYSRSAIVLRV